MIERRIVLPVQALTAESFAAFGQVATPRPGDAMPGHGDVRPDLGDGVPRFYIMRLARRGLRFHQIARHVRVTQCLGALGGKPWLIAAAPPADLANPAARPAQESIQAFRVPADCFIMLHRGTWHAGPYFDAADCIDFFNLELADTNSVDFQECDLREAFAVQFAFARNECHGPSES